MNLIVLWNWIDFCPCIQELVFPHNRKTIYFLPCSISLMLGNLCTCVVSFVSRVYSIIDIFSHKRKACWKEHKSKTCTQIFQKIEFFVLYFFKILIYLHSVISYIRGRNTLGNMFSIQTEAQLNLQNILFPILTLRKNSSFCGIYKLGVKKPNIFFLSKVLNTCHTMPLFSFQVWLCYSCLFKTL